MVNSIVMFGFVRCTMNCGDLWKVGNLAHPPAWAGAMSKAVSMEDETVG